MPARGLTLSTRDVTVHGYGQTEGVRSLVLSYRKVQGP
jgi:hypothetical protein